MRSEKEQTLSHVIRQFVQLYKLESRLNETNAIKSWEVVVGPVIQAHTVNLRIEKGILYVKLDSDILRNELLYSKNLLLKNLNQAAKEAIITDIVFV
ncbi:MAG: DUF721 domain-containing protein [Lentimicrobiaceae bacterium]|jgi:hypothetical protein|nr:DUF721 domain-containing protein [Lentimicrobiaceae bacterium]